MNSTLAQALDRVRLHLAYVRGLQDGSIGASDIAVAGMTPAEALTVERRNVRYCCGVARNLRLAGEAQ
jgi:hypothetical protein